MHFYLNKVTIAGNLGRDPEFRTTQNGKQIGNLTVAVGKSYKGKDGQYVNTTEWINVVVFNEHALKTVEKASKGTPVYVEGEFTTRKWTDSSGNDKYSTEVVLGIYDGVFKIIEDKSREEQRTETKSSSRTSRTSNKPAERQWDLEDDSDVIPF